MDEAFFFSFLSLFSIFHSTDVCVMALSAFNDNPMLAGFGNESSSKRLVTGYWLLVQVKVKVKVGTRLNRVRFVLGRKDALSVSRW